MGRFTFKGYIAFAISCFMGTLGTIVVAWYGLSPVEASGKLQDEIESERQDGTPYTSPDGDEDDDPSYSHNHTNTSTDHLLANPESRRTMGST